jgi:hypothetical protein
MNDPCLCGDPYCPRCFDQRDRVLAEVGEDTGWCEDEVDRIVLLLTDLDDDLRREFFALVERDVADRRADEAISEAERRSETGDIA